MYKNSQKNRLISSAIPSLFYIKEEFGILNDEEPSCSNDLETQKPPLLRRRTPRKAALPKKITAETKMQNELAIKTIIESEQAVIENSSIELALKIVEKYCSPTVFMLVKSQLDKQRRGCRYLNDIN